MVFVVSMAIDDSALPCPPRPVAVDPEFGPSHFPDPLDESFVSLASTVLWSECLFHFPGVEPDSHPSRFLKDLFLDRKTIDFQTIYEL